MLGRMSMMLDVIAIVQKQQIVNRSVMASGSACMLVMAVNPAKQKPDGVSGKDRKSTRLNSSHSQISYAVFCLKKKTTYPSASSECASDAPVPRRTTACFPSHRQRADRTAADLRSPA